MGRIFGKGNGMKCDAFFLATINFESTSVGGNSSSRVSMGITFETW